MAKVAQPRVPLSNKDEWDEEQREIISRNFSTDNPANIFKTLIRHKKLLKRWLIFANHILGKSTLPARERELVILRIGWLCQAEYEWAQHVVIGKRCGLSEEEIDHICQGPEAEEWSALDSALLQATDELHSDAFISDSTWNTLNQTYDEKQLMDLVFTVGNYNLVSMALNTFGVPLDPGLKGFK